jgi:hypothetical protein
MYYNAANINLNKMTEIYINEITKNMPEYAKIDKTERAFAELKKLKDEKKKAKMTLHLDGSGSVNKIEVAQFI